MSEIGRPSSFSQDVANKICDRLADGMSLRKVCSMSDVPSIETVRKWLRAGDEGKDKKMVAFLAQYTRAREEQADFFADDIIEQSDKAYDKDSAAAAKVKVDARKWVASKLKPKRYGEKIDVTSAGKRVETTPLVISNIRPRSENASGDIKENKKQ